VALPALVLLLGFGLGAIDATTDKLRCVDAARDAALTQARGGDGASIGRAEAPTGSRVTVTIVGDTAHATVTMVVKPLGSHLPSVSLTSTAIAAVEPGGAS
jgi:hypothetical protein